MIDSLSTLSLAGTILAGSPAADSVSVMEVNDNLSSWPVRDFGNADSPLTYLLDFHDASLTFIPSLAKSSFELIVERLEELKFIHGAAAEDALTFISSMHGGIPVPTVVASESGSIALVWKRENIYMDAEFDGDGLVSMFGRIYGEDKVDIGEDEIPVEAKLNVEAYNLLKYLERRSNAIAA